MDEKMPFSVESTKIVWKSGRETVVASAVLPGIIRIRAWYVPTCTDDYVTIEVPHDPIDAHLVQCAVNDTGTVLVADDLQCEISNSGRISFFQNTTGDKLLEETNWLPTNPTLFPKSRTYTRLDGKWEIQQRFLPVQNEHFFGLGQHRCGVYDYKGSVIMLQQQNGETCIPFLLSSLKYAFVWNNPSLGRVELTTNHTCWIAENARKIDYYVITGMDFSQIYARYVDLVGHAPQLPYWATGFWQSKLRYTSQAEVVSVVKKYQEKHIPLSAIVIDYLHWTKMGDFTWDPNCWPSPKDMVQTLKEANVTVIASIWPAVNPHSVNAKEFSDKGYLVEAKKGVNNFFPFTDTNDIPPVIMHYYDSTNPAARNFLWEKIKSMYYDIGITNYWLDACEPEIEPYTMDNLLFYLGEGDAVGNLYPLCHQQGIFESLSKLGIKDTVLLCRSGWLGSQRYASALWSGDILSDWQTFSQQIHIGLNVGLSGIPWWTSDIGGFLNGNIHDKDFHELLVRWFEFGVFCPICRLHGNREPRSTVLTESGADNEIWSFGEDVYTILKKMLCIRERLRPYIYQEMKKAADFGLPMMRPLFFDYMQDAICWSVDDEYLFGSSLIVAPVHEKGARKRKVYLPKNTRWIDAWTGDSIIGGTWFTAAAELDDIPVFIKEHADGMLAEVFEKEE